MACSWGLWPRALNQGCQKQQVPRPHPLSQVLGLEAGVPGVAGRQCGRARVLVPGGPGGAPGGCDSRHIPGGRRILSATGIHAMPLIL